MSTTDVPQTIAVDPWHDPARPGRTLGVVARDGDHRIEIPWDWLTDYLDEIVAARFGTTAPHERAVAEWIRNGQLSGDWLAADMTHTRSQPKHRDEDERSKTTFGRFLVGLLGGIQAEPE